MLLSIFSGLKYSYCYEVETGHFLLHDNDFISHFYLQGDDARVFREEIELIDKLQNPENITSFLIEEAISVYF